MHIGLIQKSLWRDAEKLELSMFFYINPTFFVVFSDTGFMVILEILKREAFSQTSPKYLLKEQSSLCS